MRWFFDCARRYRSVRIDDARTPINAAKRSAGEDPSLCAFGVIALFLPLAANAARPMITDDARVVDTKACQAESWVKFNKNGEEYWALPACNFTGNFELTLGGAVGKDETGSSATDIVFQGKTLLKPLKTNGYGVGLAFGYVAHSAINPNRNLLGDFYGYVPVSFSFEEDRHVLHTNLGFLHSREKNTVNMTWGLGMEIQAVSNLFVIAETFGQSQGEFYYQAGLRYWIMPGHIQLDTTYGDRFGWGGDSRWFSIGLRLISAPFL
ncbi:MAG: hypothetical protein ACOY4D_09335 [Pseudomonadota bacterium]